MTISFPEIMTTFEVVISGSLASWNRGAMGLSAARKKEDGDDVGPGEDTGVAGGGAHAG